MIILGAGASRADGAPLQKELFPSYFSEYRARPVETGLAERLSHFFDTFFGRADDVYPTFEEALGVLDLALLRGESFRGLPNTSTKPQIQQTRDDLTLLMARVIDWRLEERNRYHRALVSRLDREGRLRRTCFISLNYDILIDNALIEIYPRHDIDYGVDFTNFHVARRRAPRTEVTPGGVDQPWRPPRRTKAVSLLKLHGSLNWLYCPACVQLSLTPKVKGALVDKPEPCRTCSTDMVPIVIPPTFFKVMSNFYLQQVWHAAEEVLANAKRLYFCGYSFPDADMHVKYLLKRAEVNRSDSRFEIFVANECVDKRQEERNAEERRFRRYFCDGARVHYKKVSFETFATTGYVGE